MAFYSDTTPRPGDTEQVLLGKLLQVLGGSPTGADGVNNLLQKLVTVANAADTGGTLENFADNGTEAEILRNGGAERVLITNDQKHLILSGRRISIDEDDTTVAFVAGTSKARAAYFDVFGQDNPTFPGYVTMTFKNGGQFRIQAGPDDSLSSTALMIVHGTGGVEQIVETLTYAASVELDFLNANIKEVSLTGDIEFTTANLGAGRSCSVRIEADGSTRSFTFPANWVFVGTAPTDIASGKTGVLSLTAYGSTDATVVAAYAVEP